jgi:hypothetical protein
MQFLVYGIITASIWFEYLGDAGYTPSALAYTQELLAMAAAAVVVVAGVQQRFVNVLPAYWFILAGLLVTVVCGLLTNGVEAGPIFAGLRTYLRAIPFFFLPAVVNFSPRQIKSQLVLVLVFALPQLPIALDQRLTTFARGFFSGDRTVGTLGDSGALTVFLVCVASMLFAFLSRRLLSRKWAFVLLPVVLAPTMLNETKATLVLLPAALIAVSVLGATTNRAKRALVTLISTGVFVAAFIPTYDYFMKPRYGYGLIEFLTMEGRVERYLERDAEVGSYDVVPGKIDAITVPLQVLSRDPALLAFGLGIGNVSHSALGDRFSGEHYQRYGHFVQSSMSRLLWELGLLGTSLLFALMAMLFVDAFRVSRGDGFMATLALGTMGVVTVITLSLLSATLMDSGAISYLFWYIAGLVAAERARSLVRVADTPRVGQPLPV